MLKRTLILSLGIALFAGVTGLAQARPSHDTEIASLSATTRAEVCTVKPILRTDGTLGSYADIEFGQWLLGLADTTSPFYQAQPAIFVQGYGTMCQISDVFSYGGDPSSFLLTSYKVNEAGERAPHGASDADWGALYDYYVHGFRL
jgi:hypothetical protein